MKRTKSKGLSDYFLIDIKIILKLIICCCLPSQAIVLANSEEYKYSPRIQTEGKIGNRRSIVRPAALIPLYQRADSIIHLSLIGMSDTRNALEGNIGIGVRHLIKNNIFGLYGFYDIRRSAKNNIIHQATIGAEWFKKFFEFRFNVYLPKKREFQTSQVTNVSNYRKSGSTIDIQLLSSNEVEQALPGFDIDVGSQLPILPDLTVRAAFYRFASSDKHIQTRNGVRGVIAYQLFEFLQLDAEVSYDNQRKTVFFGGITLGYNFDKSAKKHIGLTRLEKKMNIIPIRDIDAVVGGGQQRHTVDEIQIDGLDEDTTIFVVNPINNILTMLDIVNGQLIILFSKYNNENKHISTIIEQFIVKDIITDTKFLTYMIDENGIIDVNQITYSAHGLTVKHGRNYTASDKDRNLFVSVTNSISASATNIKWGSFEDEQWQEKSGLQRQLALTKKNALQKQQLLTQQLNELQYASQHTKQELQDKMRQQQQLSIQRQNNLQSQLDNLNETSNRAQQELGDRIVREQQLAKEQQELLQQQLHTLNENANRIQHQLQQVSDERDLAIEQQQNFEQSLKMQQKQNLLQQLHLKQQLHNINQSTLQKQHEFEQSLKEAKNLSNTQQSNLKQRLQNEREIALKQQEILQQQFNSLTNSSSIKQKQLEKQTSQMKNEYSLEYSKFQTEVDHLNRNLEDAKINHSRQMQGVSQQILKLQNREMSYKLKLKKQTQKFKDVEQLLQKQLNSLTNSFSTKQEQLKKELMESKKQYKSFIEITEKDKSFHLEQYKKMKSQLLRLTTVMSKYTHIIKFDEVINFE